MTRHVLLALLLVVSSAACDGDSATAAPTCDNITDCCQSDAECGADGTCLAGDATFCHTGCIELWEDRTFGCIHDQHCCGAGVCDLTYPFTDGVPESGVCVW